ncbi:uncharacterized protein [Procambarus clarkii]|nr:uncharacterized protein LOC123764132 isoform X2 [Procambarus clarkii]
MSVLLEAAAILVVWADAAGGVGSSTCNALFPRDQQSQPVYLPAIMQFEQGAFRSWESQWEVVTAEGEEPLACLEVAGATLLTSVRLAASGCDVVSGWEQTAEYPPFVPGEGQWQNVFSLFVTSSDGSFSVDLNRRPDYAVIQRLVTPTESNDLPQDQVPPTAVGIRRVNMTHGGPKVKFPAVWRHGKCLGVADCYNGWAYLSLQPTDTASLAHMPGEDIIEVKISLSNCFPDYLIGVHRIPAATNSTSWSLAVRYRREGRYHSLTATLDGATTLFSTTVEHHGRDCSGSWFLLGVRGAKIFPNCYSDSVVHPVMLFSRSSASMLNGLYALYALMLLCLML